MSNEHKRNECLCMDKRVHVKMFNGVVGYFILTVQNAKINHNVTLHITMNSVCVNHSLMLDHIKWKQIIKPETRRTWDQEGELC